MICFDVPVLFLIFNRPETTRRVFEAIRQQKPAKLFIASDGPRPDKENEADLCEECRQIVMTGIDWECDVKTLFRNENLGCGKAVASAISWFFSHIEAGIILEDDVLPTKSFFLFSREMLLKYKNETDIMHISGNNFQLSQVGSNSYYFSKIPHCWGWATWRRAWKKFDFELKEFREGNEYVYFGYPSIDNYWNEIFTITKQKLFHQVWDYQWVFANFKNNGLSIIPQQNLVSNIGFGQQSTNTTNAEDYLANLKSYEMEFEVADTQISYNPTADINFHKLFRWEKTLMDNNSITFKAAINILLTKIKSKISIGRG